MEMVIVPIIVSQLCILIYIKCLVYTITVSCFYFSYLPSLRNNRDWENAISQDAEASEITPKALKDFPRTQTKSA